MDLVDINDAVPIFSREDLLYYRDEKDGYMTFIPGERPEIMEIIGKPTLKELLSLCDSQKSTADIIKALRDQYPGVPPQQLQDDIFKTLGSYSKMGVITWKNQNPFKNQVTEDKRDGYYITVGYESHLCQLLDFFSKVGFLNSTVNRETYYYYCNPGLKIDQEYCDVVVRQKLFSFIEDFFILWKDDEIEGLFTINTSHLANSNRKSALVFLVIMKKEDKLFGLLLDYALKVFPFFAVANPLKVKFISEVKDNQVIDKFKQAGFVWEHSLKNEFDFDSEAFVYSYFFEKEKIAQLKRHTPRINKL